MLSNNPSPIHTGCSLSQAEPCTSTNPEYLVWNTPGKPIPEKPPSWFMALPKSEFFWEREASTISGVEWGPQQKSVKSTSHTAPLLYCYTRLLIPLAHGFPSLFQALVHNTSASRPKSQRFHTIPQDHRESLTAQVGCDQHAKEKTYTVLLLSRYLPTPLICKG